jgi:hypothetical protein
MPWCNAPVRACDPSQALSTEPSRHGRRFAARVIPHNRNIRSIQADNPPPRQSKCKMRGGPGAKEVWLPARDPAVGRQCPVAGPDGCPVVALVGPARNNVVISGPSSGGSPTIVVGNFPSVLCPNERSASAAASD